MNINKVAVVRVSRPKKSVRLHFQTVFYRFFDKILREGFSYSLVSAQNKMKAWNIIFGLFLLFFVITTWSSYFLVKQTYDFWNNGIEKQAMVVAFDHSNRSNKSGSTYFYTLELENEKFQKEFRFELPVGKLITVLVLPGNNQELIVGNKNSGLFKIFSNMAGNGLFAIILIGLFIYLLWFFPVTFMRLIKKRDGYKSNKYR